MTISRRSFFVALGVLPLLSAKSAARLTSEASNAKMLFGCAVRADQLFADRDFRNLVAEQCGEITPELELKWAHAEPKPGDFDFTDADELSAFAARHAKAVHGHTLLWHDSIPEWANQAMLAQKDWTIIARFFETIIPRYRSTISTWDVVNEPIDVVSGIDGMRNSTFLKAFGPDYVSKALIEARRIEPSIKLFINEYGLIYNLPEAVEKRRAMLALIDQLQAANIPLDGVGVQAHLELEYHDTFNANSFRDFLNAVGQRGLEIRITELDVKENQTDRDSASRDIRAADAVRSVLDIAVANRAVGTITSWGLSDRYSWLPNAGEAAGFNRGLPYDTDLQVKPMFQAIKRALQSRQ